MNRFVRFLALAAAFYALSGCTYFEGKKMAEIKFDLGKNIIETARASGVPKFQTDNTAGLIEYSVNQIPAEIPALYTRSGYEITIVPLFAFTMYADNDSKNDLAVESVTLQIDNTLNSHEAGQAFVESILAQFHKGKWKRSIREYCPAVSGRSTLLSESGELDKMEGCPLDPDYKLTKEEWFYMMSSTQYYEWTGDGVIAKLSVDYSNDSRGITYNVALEFEDEKIQKKRFEQKMADDIKEGEAKGWHTAARVVEDKKKTEARNKKLEENALKRGDLVVPR